MRNFKSLTIILIAVLFINVKSTAQLGVGTTSPDASSMFDVQSTSKGVLIPRMISAQRVAISSAANGLLVFDTSTQSFWFYSGSWIELASGAFNTIVDTDNDTKIEVEKTTDEDIIRFSTAGTEKMQIDGSGNTRIGDGINNTYIESDGSLSYEGTATRYEDLRVPMSSTRKGAAEDPTFKVFLTDGSGSVGVYGHHFKTNISEELFFEVQMPHGWVEGSDIFPHIHWSAKTNVGTDKVRWGLEFIWVNVGGTFSTTTILYGEDPIPPVGTVDAYEHVISSLGNIDGTGQTLSSMLMCRVFRDGPHSNDTYGSDAILLQIDFHYQIDADGSREEYTK